MRTEHDHFIPPVSGHFLNADEDSSCQKQSNNVHSNDDNQRENWTGKMEGGSRKRVKE